MAEFFAGLIAGLAAAGLLLIVFAPSRRVRSEPKLDEEVETQLLLGVDPDADSDELDEPVDETARSAAHADFDTAELQALRKIGTERPGAGRRRGGRR